MKISIITVCYNAALTIADAMSSVLSQRYDDVEYVVVDGKSDDGTRQIIERFIDQHSEANIKYISEPDEGIYDAMNKGIAKSTGEVIGILNADDFYYDETIIEQVASAFTPDIDAVFGDLIFVSNGNRNKTVRTYSSKNWHPAKFARGYMPAHPTFFVRKRYYDQYGLFETDYEIAADYEMLIRLLYTHQLTYRYLPLTMVKMRMGGVSSRGIKSNITLNNEIIRACRKHGIRTNAFKIYPKYFRKVFELVNVGNRRNSS